MKFKKEKGPKLTTREVCTKIWNDRTAYLMSAPYVILFTIFTVVPVVISMFFSFTYFNMLEAPQFIGLENYIRLFLKDDIFLIAIRNTVILAAITGPVGYLLCFFFAWGINEFSPKIRAIITLFFYAPSISGNAFLIFTLLFNSDSYGLVNAYLLKLGLISSPILFFQDTKYMMPLVIVVILWTSLGTSFLSFIAGFQGVDRSYYEAAAVDGVRNRWQELWFVTLPLMKESLMFSAIMSITGAFNVGPTVTGLVGFPSNGYAVHTIMHHLEDYGGQRFEMGYASAIATVLFIVMISVNVVIQKIIRKVGQ
ncbi:MAG: sugar ABC transporter permease [Clostridia bacterium]|nr:sugar ABC transporter permease [Clostridia bacterium]